MPRLDHVYFVHTKHLGPLCCYEKKSINSRTISRVCKNIKTCFVTLRQSKTMSYVLLGSFSMGHDLSTAGLHPLILVLLFATK